MKTIGDNLKNYVDEFDCIFRTAFDEYTGADMPDIPSVPEGSVDRGTVYGDCMQFFEDKDGIFFTNSNNVDTRLKSRDVVEMVREHLISAGAEAKQCWIKLGNPPLKDHVTGVPGAIGTTRPDGANWFVRCSEVGHPPNVRTEIAIGWGFIIE